MKIKRIFHPIGQGAFYSERHENLNIVYDCGNWKNTKQATKIVQSAFKKDEVIDILFISHFDYDHVSKISILKQHTIIKRVILPLLNKKQKNFLTNVYRLLNVVDLTLINNPKKFFEKETDVIYVKASKNNTTINDTVDTVSINISKLTDKQKLESGTTLTTNNNPNWIFIPYNHEYKNRNQVLECKLKCQGFDVDRLKTDPNYTLHEIQKDVALSEKKGGKIFRQIYDQLSGKINENSMVVYSGVDKQCQSQINYKYGGRTFKKTNDLSNRVSCIYTGDTDLNVVKIKNKFSLYWKYVNTIQIPHHGSENDFDKSVLDDKFYVCPISVATKNTYSHPSSKVIAKIISQHSYPILITENTNTEFTEEITIS